MLDWLAPKTGEKILDIACGMGELSLIIARKGAQVCGLDKSEKSIEVARQLSRMARISCDFKVGDALNLPYPNNYFDKIVCSSSLEHFADDDQALKEMKRVLRSEGHIVLTTDRFTVPIKEELKEKHRKRCFVMRYYTRESLQESFQKCNLSVRRSDYLIKSSLPGFFLKQWIKYPEPVFYWIAVAFWGYPLFLASEKLAGHREGGYTLIAEAVK
jgi:ubiquinone/menaquinone biosynthesis C-methylase UbiE